MATPTPVDQTVQRDHTLPPDQADTPGSTHTKDLEGGTDENGVLKDDLSPSAGPATPVVTADCSEISQSLPNLTLSSSSSASSSPQTSSTEDGPQEASSYPYSDSDYDSDYDSDSSDEDPFTSEPADDMEDKYQRPIETCLGEGCQWAQGGPLPNRTFANEHVAVARSALQGYGVFAAARIEAGTDVLAEAPLLRARGLGRLGEKHAKLGDEERAVYDGLVGYHEWETCPVRQKWSANSFDLARGHNGVFAIASNFNHACKAQRNTKYEWDERRGVMTFTAIRDIEEGAELLISYCNYRHVLKAVYGFICHCGGCEHQEATL